MLDEEYKEFSLLHRYTETFNRSKTPRDKKIVFTWLLRQLGVVSVHLDRYIEVDNEKHFKDGDMPMEMLLLSSNLAKLIVFSMDLYYLINKPRANSGTYMKIELDNWVKKFVNGENIYNVAYPRKND